MATLNLGILAHVDAGKTTLTERILYETGVIAALGSVDKGTTQTDTLELERARGITIKSAVVSFQLGDLKVNLIDTPGHSDFIAEVERSLRVLDGVVLVVSAVEGVQSQTRRLAAALQAADLPLVIFVNKIDRLGARGEPLFADISHKLGLRVVQMNQPSRLGERDASAVPLDRDSPEWLDPLADLLAEADLGIIAEFERTGGALSRPFLESALRAQVRAGGVAPVYFGSAMTGAGVRDLLDGVQAWLPPADSCPDDPALAPVFKITRKLSGEKLVYVRLTSGRLAVRQRVLLHHRTRFGEIERAEARITGIDGFRSGTSAPVQEVLAGDIAALHGLREARIGDLIGDEVVESPDVAPAFPLPALESVVRPVDPGQLTGLRTALEELAEQDPLISLRQRDDLGEISVRLYGEVQKEVMAETLAREYGIAVQFEPSRIICVERPVGKGQHLELMGEDGNPFWATVGITLEPGAPGSGIHYAVREFGSMPPAHYRAVEEAIYDTLSQGLCGWEVTDCRITLTDARTVQYSSPLSTAGDFRKLAPLVLMQALLQAGTAVCEPIERLELDVPEDTVGAVCSALIRARGAIQDTYPEGAFHRIVCELPTAELPGIEQQLPGLSRGEGNWVSSYLRHEPVQGEPPTRPRAGLDPLNRERYLAEVS